MKRLLSLSLSLRLKFIFVISLCLGMTMTIGIVYLQGVQAKAFEREARLRSEIVADFGEANRKFVGEHLRPTMEKYTKDFVLEAMSATYSTRAIFGYFNEVMPAYLYRQPTLNPLNSLDQADEFDHQIIQQFQSDRALKEITGYRRFKNQEAFFVAKPIQVEASCLKCHLSPEAAPIALVQKFGSTNGYGWKVGDIISALMIQVPTQDLRANQAELTQTVVVTFAWLAISLMGLIYGFFGWLVNQRLGNIIQVMGQVSVAPSSKTRLCDRSKDELGFVARTFNQMANSLEFAYSDLEQKVAERTVELEQTLAQLQRTQGQMVQSEKMSSLGRLVAGVAHEINNPINFIHGNLTHVRQYTHGLLRLIQQYQQAYPHPGTAIEDEAELLDLEFIQADLPKLLSSMAMGTSRIRDIVLSLRKFSRVDEAESKAVNLHEGIESTLLILHHRLKETPQRSAIEVIKDYGDLPLVYCYPGPMNQVFMHILSNAIDALDEREAKRNPQEAQDEPLCITIRTAVMAADRVQITIADNGAGIPNVLKNCIFDPFFTTKPVGQGTGLGMSISYQIIVDQHGGSLECFSHPDQGTEFVIQIPFQ